MIKGTAGKLELYSDIPKSSNGSILFCHGICHAAWCWEKFLPFFSEQGFASYAISYRQHGKSDKGFSIIKNYVDDVEDAIDFITDESGFRPHIVGHSMGGAVVQKMLGQHYDRISSATLFASATAPKMPILKTFIGSWFIQCFRLANIIACSGKAFAGETLLKSAFFSGGNINAVELDRYSKLLQREPLFVPFELFLIKYSNNYDIPQSFPILVMGSRNDSYFPEESIKKTAEMYKRKPFILDGLCHDMMLDVKWEEAANCVLDFIVQHPCNKIKQ
ncbi:alpha/beta hydrolase [Candidatus Saccharibacteria bacterium]|nr:alpha/beta hydrolase [Candidatus Saccharibacteria bacterium]